MDEQLFILFNKTDNVVHNGKPMTINQINDLIFNYKHCYEWQLIPFEPIPMVLTVQ